MALVLTAEIASFTIMFREALEAALVISIISTYLAKIGRKEQIKYLWYGTIIAIVASLALGGSILVIYSTLSGIAEEIFEGVTSLIAAGVLTFMIVWMAKNAKSLKKEIQQRIDSTLTGRQIFGIASLAFIVVFREGLETVLFLTALVITDPTGSIIGISTALVSVSVLAMLIWKGAYRLDVRKFFKVTSIVLVIFAAGLTAFGIHELNEAGVIPGVIEPLWDLNPAVIEGEPYPLLHERGTVGLVLKSLVGYNGNPSLTEVTGYLIYWLVVGAFLLKTYAFPQISRARDEKLNS